jgi:hypothetical protein
MVTVGDGTGDLLRAEAGAVTPDRVAAAAPWHGLRAVEWSLTALGRCLCHGGGYPWAELGVAMRLWV